MIPEFRSLKFRDANYREQVRRRLEPATIKVKISRIEERLEEGPMLAETSNWGVLVRGGLIVTTAHAAIYDLNMCVTKLKIEGEPGDGPGFLLSIWESSTIADVATLGRFARKPNETLDAWSRSVEPVDLSTDDITPNQTIAVNALVRGGWIPGIATLPPSDTAGWLQLKLETVPDAGDCGSPIVDDAGRLVGIVSAYNTQIGHGRIPWLSRALPRWALDRVAFPPRLAAVDAGG